MHDDCENISTSMQIFQFGFSNTMLIFILIVNWLISLSVSICANTLLICCSSVRYIKDRVNFKMTKLQMQNEQILNDLSTY